MFKILFGEIILIVLGLNEGKDYYFRVYVENKYGKSFVLEVKEVVVLKRVLGIFNYILFFCNRFLKYVLIILFVSDFYFYFFDVDFMYFIEFLMFLVFLYVKDIIKILLILIWEFLVSGFEGIIGYNIERRFFNSDEWERVVRVFGKVLSYYLKGFKEGYVFFFRVIVENVVGISKFIELRFFVELKGRKGMIILI